MPNQSPIDNRKSKIPTTPQQRSDLARKAAHARWSRTPQPSPPVHTQTHGRGQGEGDLPSPPVRTRTHGRGQGEGLSSLLTADNINTNSWLTTRFCLQLYQNPAGEWHLLTPAGLDIPASHGEVSLWLDLLALKSAQSAQKIR